jgi:16S rRNA (cytosine1402-N4)-methyltransferase
MTDRDSQASDFVPAPAPHVSVLADEVIECLSPQHGGLYIDATFGAGGHTRRILDAANCRVIGIDRDPNAIALGADLVEQANGRLILTQDRFSELENVLVGLGQNGADGILIDLGVSSMQLDQPERGFSFRFGGPLDMRMGASEVSAEDVIARGSERDLARIIATLGEERHARAVARAIVAARSERAIQTTSALADIIGRVVRSRPGEIHPATRTFQALRMFVNEELEEIASALIAAERVLRPGGRLAVISFHSLEDRMVKRFLSSRSRAPAVSRHQPKVSGEAPSFVLLTNKAVVADADEIARNPRARSAKLRAAERTANPPHTTAVEAMPALPGLFQVLRGD